MSTEFCVLITRHKEDATGSHSQYIGKFHFANMTDGLAAQRAEGWIIDSAVIKAVYNRETGELTPWESAPESEASHA